MLALQRMLGHDKASTTLDVYSDLFDRDLDDLADCLSAVRGQHAADNLRTTGHVEVATLELKVA